jgi:hypothetical protein
MFGVIGVRASACPIGLNRRAKRGRRKFSMTVMILLGVLPGGSAADPRSPARYLADSRQGSCGNAAVGFTL